MTDGTTVADAEPATDARHDTEPEAHGEADPATAEASAASHAREQGGRARFAVELPVVLAAALAAIPVLVAAWWTSANGWRPTGDRSITALLGGQVFTSHTPLIGAISTLRVEVDGTERAIHALGPLQFWVLAGPYELTGERPVGLLIAVALVNIASLAIAAVFVARRLGTVAAVATMAGAAIMLAALGPALLHDSWNPHITMLPLLALAALCFAAIDGDDAAGPWLVGVASFIAQTHLSVVLLAALLGGAGAVGWLLARRRDRPALRRQLVRSGSVALVLWALPLIQQLQGDGNLGLLVRSLGQQSARAGSTWTLARFADGLTVPPLWMRRIDHVGDLERSASTASLLGLGLFVVLFATAVVLAHRDRRTDPTRLHLLVTTAVILVGGWATLRITPEAGRLAIQYVRWWWPLGMVAWGTVGLSLLRAAALRRDPAADPVRRRLALQGAGLAIAALAAVVGSQDQRFPTVSGWTERRLSEATAAQILANLDDEPTLVSFAGATTGLATGPEIVRVLNAAGRTVRVPYPDAYTPHLVSTGGLPQSLLILGNDRVDPPGARPLEVVALGRYDGAPTEAWVDAANGALDGVDAGGPLTFADDVVADLVAVRAEVSDRPAEDVAATLAQPWRAVFDRQVLLAIADGRATTTPIPPETARVLADGLDGAGALAILIPPKPAPAGP